MLGNLHQLAVALHQLLVAAGGERLVAPASLGKHDSANGDYEERNLDINDLVVPHPTTSFFMRVSGDSMTGACIYSDDIIVIDRAVTAANNRIVVARIGEEFTLKRLQIMQHRKIFLKPENPKYTAIEVTSRDDFEVWGVVTWVLHRQLRRV
jgi:DNA polymerase V